MKRCLYNNITLPETWPPKYPRTLFTERRMLPVPYLENPPEVIRLDRGRELFVDDFLIASTTCVRKFHYPEKSAENPILKPETELELGNGQYPACACPKSGGVWFNYEKRIFQIWYEAGFLGTICYAESDDAIHWKRPDLDVFPGTNRVLPYGLKSDSWTVVHDYYTDDPAQKFKMFLMEPCPSIARGMVGVVKAKFAGNASEKIAGTLTVDPSTATVSSSDLTEDEITVDVTVGEDNFIALPAGLSLSSGFTITLYGNAACTDYQGEIHPAEPGRDAAEEHR